MKKVILALTLLISLYGVSVSAGSEIMDWHLVDSGKHLDWDGSTVYQSNFDFGVDLWEAYKAGVIREDTIWIIQDLAISDVDVATSWAGRTGSNGTIEFNTQVMSTLTTTEKNMAAAHEIGHALGLAHNTSTDIMHYAVTSKNTLSTNDKDSYDDSYDRY